MIPNPILIFTDGASKGNPGSGGWGAIVASDDSVQEFGGREDHTTNNRMELSAAINALSKIPNSKFQILLYSDSSYVVNGITKWVHGWKKNGWQTATKKPVENQDLWEQLSGLAEGRSIEWKRIAGHADTPANTRADEIASAFADGESPQLFSGSQSEYKIDLSIIGVQSGGRRQSPYAYVSLVDGKIETHQTWGECERRVKGKTARYKKVFSKEEEDRVIADFKK
ncbi:MAG: ribonuclease HI [Candidatus Taylorbacteria bacterium RIFCSPHIGHO2_01_FULL_46_22b]|uniref:Ribonuclease H n=1 Tax=Candidatus Taylorbacteria bacterium RIFCSPHIGHO2_01_FULL_46_22b TaxID=1802301 RepID=A0A1G2M521_9BACT|nr:MAG: ribonuclease HI [Candidatus Taylorbacteria bacterium RIFCSPHIGHO2_01_FULL_46_22b]